MPSHPSSQSLFTRRIAVPPHSVLWAEGSAIDQPPEPSKLEAPALDSVQDILPRVGQSFLHFRLIDVLGEGAVGKVYLAEQPELAGRYVALKLSTDLLGEPAKLARLQHPAIMPVYSVHESGGVQAVCMPYYGRTTLADWCQSLGMMATMPSSGQQLVSTLMSKRRSLATIDQAVPQGEPVQAAAEGMATPTPLDVLATLKYSDAILLTIARIAEGLQHAHERGLVHQDLKPANILITDEGLPLILDFNLARDTRQENQILRAQVGGTLPYMSPEQLLGFSDKSANVSIDGRSDIYSLGLILFQLLAGRRPFLTPCGSIYDIIAQMLKERQTLPPDVRQFNPEVDAGTAAIVAKCLHPEAARRYQSAAELVEDIRRHRADLPLRYAANTSLSECVTKWMRRHPRLASPATVLAAAALLTLGVVALGTQSTIAQSQADYRRLHTQAYQMFAEFHERSSVAEHYLSAHGERSNWRERGEKEAHEALEKLGVFDCEAWTQRPTFAALGPEQQRQLEQRVGELAYFLVLTDTPSQQNAASESASDAAASKPEWLHHRRLRQLREQFREKRFESGRLAYFQAYALQKQGKHGQVLEILQKYMQAYPSDVNAWFTRGHSAFLLGRLSEAYHAYSTCVALRPNFAPGYYNRALMAFYQNTDPQSDLQTVLKLEPDSVEARCLLALVLQQQKKYPQALREIQMLLDKQPHSPYLLKLRAQLYEAMGQRSQARADRQAALLCRANHLQDGLAQADLLIDRDPKAALARYRALERDYPGQVKPLLGQAYIYGELLQQDAQALECLERLQRHHPEHIDVVCGRAVYLARLHRDAEAWTEAKRALRLSHHSYTHYRVGCVYAQLSQRDPQHKEAALYHLMLALDEFQGVDVFLEDPDLQHVRKLSEFKTLIDFVRLSRHKLHKLRHGDRF